jgi:hypothetical protein
MAGLRRMALLHCVEPRSCLGGRMGDNAGDLSEDGVWIGGPSLAGHRRRDATYTQGSDRGAACISWSFSSLPTSEADFGYRVIGSTRK